MAIDPAGEDVRQRPLARRLRRSILGTFALRVSAVALSFAMSVAMGRLLGVQGFGVYANVIAWTTILTAPAMFGFDRLLVRNLASFQARDEWARIRGMIRLADRTVLVAAGLLAVALAAIGFVIGDREGLGVPWAFILGALALPATVLMNVRQSALQGLHKVTLGLVAETLVRPGIVLALVGASLVIGLRQPSPLIGLAFVLVSTTIAYLAGRFALLRTLGRQANGDAVEPTAWVPSALPLAYLATVAVLAAQADVIIVGILASHAETGAYAVAVRGAALLSMPLFVINTTSAPVFARLWSLGKKAQLQRDATSAVRTATLATVPLAALLIVFAGPLLGLFGDRFDRGVTPLIILSIGRVLGTALGPTGLLLSMTGHERAAAAGATIGAVLEIGAAIALIPFLGLVGAALASAVAFVTANLVQVWYVRRKLGIRPTVLSL